MKELSENAIEILNELHATGRIENADYSILFDALDRLAEYEEIGCDSEEIQTQLWNYGCLIDEVTDGKLSKTNYELSTILSEMNSARQEECDKYCDEMQELKQYRKAEEEGRLLVLPCKKGDVLWTYCDYPYRAVYSFEVTDVAYLNGIITLNTDKLGAVRGDDVGKTVFLTRKEAEAALGGAE